MSIKAKKSLLFTLLCGIFIFQTSQIFAQSKKSNKNQETEVYTKYVHPREYIFDLTDAHSKVSLKYDSKSHKAYCNVDFTHLIKEQMPRKGDKLTFVYEGSSSADFKNITATVYDLTKGANIGNEKPENFAFKTVKKETFKKEFSVVLKEHAEKSVTLRLIASFDETERKIPATINLSFKRVRESTNIKKEMDEEKKALKKGIKIVKVKSDFSEKPTQTEETITQVETTPPVVAEVPEVEEEASTDSENTLEYNEIAMEDNEDLPESTDDISESTETDNAIAMIEVDDSTNEDDLENENQIPNSEDLISQEEDEILITEEMLSTDDENLIAKEENTPSQNELLVTQDDTSPQNKILINQDDITTQNESLISQEEISLTEEELSISEEEIAPESEILITEDFPQLEEEILSNEKLLSHEEEISTYEDKISKHEDKISKHEDKISKHEDKFSPHEEEISPHGEILLFEEEILPYEDDEVALVDEQFSLLEDDFESQEENPSSQIENPSTLEETEESPIETQSTSPLSPSTQVPKVSKYKKEYLHDYAVNEEFELEEETPVVKIIENPNKQDKNGKTMLMDAVKKGDKNLIQVLFNSGADVSLQDKEGWTALMYAARYQKDVTCLDILLETTQNVKSKNKYGLSALVFAATYNPNPQVLERLLQFYSPSDKEVLKAFVLLLSECNDTENTLFSKAKIFVEYNIPLNSFYNGKTPLMYAAKCCDSTKIINLLLENNALVTIRSTEGKTAFDYAKGNSKLPHDSVYWSLNKK